MTTMPWPPLLSWELAACLEIIYEILNDLKDIRIRLEMRQDPVAFLAPDFDPPQNHWEILALLNCQHVFFPLSHFS